MAFLEGFVVGLGMILFIGPVFFYLLKSSLQFGYKAGLAAAFGIFISDVVCILICFYGAISIFKSPDYQFGLAVIGGIILCLLGIKYMLKPSVSFEQTAVKLKAYNLTSFFMKGFLVNLINPFVFLVWIGIIGYGQNEYGVNINLFSFLGAATLGILITDSLKVIMAQKIKPFIKPKILSWTYKVIGILLIGFGIRMIIIFLYI